jgi:nitrite reductase (NADH) small subunit
MAARRRTAHDEEWQPVCKLLELEVDRGATALVHGQALAIFRTDDGSVHALGNHDPFSRTSSIAKGIVGRRGDVPFVGSPIHGHRFDLRSGRCLDDPHASVPTYEVRITDGVVLVGRRKAAEARRA